MSRSPSSLDNTAVSQFLGDFLSVSDACETCPELDHIISGVLAMKTEGDTSTRSLSRRVLFHVLQWCPAIDVASIEHATNGVYAYRTMAQYAALARVASKAIAGILHRVSSEQSTGRARQLLDAEFPLPACFVDSAT